MYFFNMLVTAAIIFNKNKILIAKRGNKWEFPGGRLEGKESLEECIKREIKEELNIGISIIKKFCIEKNNEIELHVFLARYENGNLKLRFHENAKWINIEEIDKFEFLPLDEKVVEKLKKIKNI